MIKEEKNIDFYTTGRKLSEQEFAKISEWIKNDKAKKGLHKKGILRKRSTSNKKIIAKGGADTTQHLQQ